MCPKPLFLLSVVKIVFFVGNLCTVLYSDFLCPDLSIPDKLSGKDILS